MADYKDILNFVNSSPVPAGMIQVFIGERPESPEDADMSRLVAQAPDKPKIGCIGGIRLIANENIIPGKVVLVNADVLADAIRGSAISDPSRWEWKEPACNVKVDDTGEEPKEADREP